MLMALVVVQTAYLRCIACESSKDQVQELEVKAKAPKSELVKRVLSHAAYTPTSVARGRAWVAHAVNTRTVSHVQP